MPPVVAAGVGAAASIGGGILGAKSQKKAAKQAAAAELAVAEKNNALAREIYGKNTANLNPYNINGQRAGNALTELLLGPVTTGYGGTAYGPQSTGAANGSNLDPTWASNALQAILPHLSNTDNPDRGYYTAYRDYVSQHGDGQYLPGGQINPTWAAGAMQAILPHLTANVQNNPDRGISQAWSGYSGSHPVQYASTTPTTGTGGTGSAPTAPSAWDTFRNSTNYQFRLGEGQRALNSGYAANGTLQSGAALQALQEHGQNFASNELMNYMNLLSNQQNTGVGAASAIAGVGQNLVSNVSANNNNAGNAAANAALVNGQANANMWQGIAGGIGGLAGSLFPSSYGR